MPNNIEDYVHRIGRTGRAGKKGTAITYFSEGQNKLGRELVKILEQAEQEVPQELRDLARYSSGGGGGRGGRGRSGGGFRRGGGGMRSGANMAPLGRR
jgi:ATP-dependent RNA helicase DDX5/DBP2